MYEPGDDYTLDDEEEDDGPLFDDDQGSLALATTGNDLDLAIDRDNMRRAKRKRDEDAYIEQLLREAGDVSIWEADNRGAAHVPVLPKTAVMTPIDTAPVDPHLGVHSVTELMRRARDESRVNKEGVSLPSGGSGSSNGGGKAKKMPKAKKAVAIPANEKGVIVFRIRGLTFGEHYLLVNVLGQEWARRFIASHVSALIRNQLPAPTIASNFSEVADFFYDVYGLDEIPAQLLRLHRGSTRLALINHLYDKYADRISSYSEGYAS